MSSNTDPVARFAHIAERYSTWVEGPRIGRDEDLHLGYVLLLDLMRAALELPNREPTGAESERPTREEYLAVFDGFAWVPVQYYWDAEPNVDGPQELMTGDLHDDLADTWRDVMEGLHLYRSNFVDDACWNWRFSFGAHWGEHAANALRIMTTMNCHRDGGPNSS